MWAGKDNGKDMSWKKAMKYCRDLRLAGFSDWRLPTIDELQGVRDKDGYYGIKGHIVLTGGDQWSSSRVNDDRGRPSGYAWYFIFSLQQRIDEPLGYFNSKRALCVRRAAE